MTRTMKKQNTAYFILSLALSVFTFSSQGQTNKNILYPQLKSYCDILKSGFEKITAERKIELEEIASYVLEMRDAHKPANLLFVCTSNSRRSHMAQVWSQIGSYYYAIDSVFTFSGGTEQTRVHPNTLGALRRTGIQIYSNNQGSNPLQYVQVGESIKPWGMFSKKYSDSTNPQKNFAAMMVCSEADKGCPYVEGADMRIGLPYNDPKEFDNTAAMSEKYDERCKQIATEMFYIMFTVRYPH
jgi:hypothetical protein